MENVKIRKVKDGAKLPSYESAYAAGADLYACVDGVVTIPAGETRVIDTGIALALPVGYAGLIYARSGLATRSGLAPANKVGVVDCDYRGEVKVALHNHSKIDQTVENGERVAQLVITPYYTAVFEEVDALPETERGAGGFGSTGKK